MNIADPDYCSRCRKVTPYKVTEHPDGTEFTCAICGKRTDYWFRDDLFHEEDDYYAPGPNLDP